MVIFRKGKKTLLKEPTAYDIAENPQFAAILAAAGATDSQIRAKIQFLNQNAFALAIRGAQARLGNGYIVECEK